MNFPEFYLVTRQGFNLQLSYDSVSQGLGTTKFTNLIGWNGYWPQSRFSHPDQHLDRWCFEVKKLQTKMQNHWLFSSNNIYFCECQRVDEKKSKEDEQTLEELYSAHRRSQVKCQLVQTSYIKRIKLFLFFPYNKHLIDRAKSVCMGESWTRSCVCVQSVLTTSVKILPTGPPAR